MFPCGISFIFRLSSFIILRNIGEKIRTREIRKSKVLRGKNFVLTDRNIIRILQN